MTAQTYFFLSSLFASQFGFVFVAPFSILPISNLPVMGDDTFHQSQSGMSQTNKQISTISPRRVQIELLSARFEQGSSYSHPFFINLYLKSVCSVLFSHSMMNSKTSHHSAQFAQLLPLFITGDSSLSGCVCLPPVGPIYLSNMPHRINIVHKQRNRLL